MLSLCHLQYSTTTPRREAEATAHTTSSMVPSGRRLYDRSPTFRFTHWYPSRGRPLLQGMQLIPLKGLPTAFETANLLFHHVFRHFGLPQSNGQTERKIQEIGRYLRTYCHQNQGSWNRFLPWAEYAQNSLRQDTTGLTPFQCILGYQPPLFPWSGEPSEVPAVNTWFEASERVWDSAHIHLQRGVRRHQSQADTKRGDTPQYQPGQKVWLSTRDIRLHLPCQS